MLRCIVLRLALPAVLSAVLIPAATFAQSQDTQSVAEAARRAREQKKAATNAKPARVITEDDVKPATPDATPASGFPTPPPNPGGTANPPAGAPAAEGSKDAKERDAKELAELKEKFKQAQSDLDLMQREAALAQDTFYSNPDYAHDTAGKAKLDTQKQQIGDKQEEVARLKARIQELQPPPDASAPATPAEPPASTPPVKP